MGRVYEGVGEAWVAFNEGESTRAHKKGKRVSFDDEDLYSYSTIVARYRENGDGEKFVIATDRKYSVSTSSHISNCVRHCTVPVFYTYDIWAPDAAILAGMVSNFRDSVRTAIRSYKNDWFDWSYLVCAEHKVVVQFCRLTGLKHPLPTINEVTAAIARDRHEKLEAFNDPKAVARRVRSRARRAAKEALKIAA